MNASINRDTHTDGRLPVFEIQPVIACLFLTLFCTAAGDSYFQRDSVNGHMTHTSSERKEVNVLNCRVGGMQVCVS